MISQLQAVQQQQAAQQRQRSDMAHVTQLEARMLKLETQAQVTTIMHVGLSNVFAGYGAICCPEQSERCLYSTGGTRIAE